MGRVAPSVIAREQLQELLTGGMGRGSNIVSALVETVTRFGGAGAAGGRAGGLFGWPWPL
jgi:hypothetical protein